MKRILTILFLLFTINGYSQYYFSTAEYYYGVVKTSTGTAYQINGTASAIGSLSNIVTMACGAHHELALDASGNVHATGDNAYGECGNGTTTAPSGWITIATDSLGNAFTGIVQIVCGAATNCSTYGWSSYAVKGDGTVWGWGSLIGDMRGSGGPYAGSGTTTRPVQIKFPGNPVIVKIAVSNYGVALDNLGRVWTWGGNNCSNLHQNYLGQGATPVTNTPTLITMPSSVKDITAGIDAFALLNTGSVMAWGPYYGGMAVGFGNQQFWPEIPYGGSNIPIKIDTALGLGHIAKIASNSGGEYFIDTAGNAFYVGDKTNGCGGDGIEMNWASYPTPYNWDQGYGELYDGLYGIGTFQQRKPTPILPGVKIDTFYDNNNLWYSMYGRTQDGRYFSMGRGKSGGLGNQILACDVVIGGINGSYPNSFDHPWATILDMAALFGSTNYSSTCPKCIGSPSGSPCSNCINGSPATITPIISAVGIGTGSTVVLSAASSSNNKGYYSPYYLFTQTAGTPQKMRTQANITDTLYNVPNGNYSFSLKIQDQWWDSATATISITVNVLSPNQPNQIVHHRNMGKDYINH